MILKSLSSQDLGTVYKLLGFFTFSSLIQSGILVLLFIASFGLGFCFKVFHPQGQYSPGILQGQAEDTDKDMELGDWEL